MAGRLDDAIGAALGTRHDALHHRTFVDEDLADLELVNVGAEENGDPVLFMDVDGKAKISLGFTDKAAIKAKKLKVGDELTVTCKIGGAMDNLMQVTDCVAK